MHLNFRLERFPEREFELCFAMKAICFSWRFMGCAEGSQPWRTVAGFACRSQMRSDCFSRRHVQLDCPSNANKCITSNIIYDRWLHNTIHKPVFLNTHTKTQQLTKLKCVTDVKPHTVYLYWCRSSYKGFLSDFISCLSLCPFFCLFDYCLIGTVYQCVRHPCDVTCTWFSSL